MRWNANDGQEWRASLRRILIHVAVLGAHLGMVVALLGDVTPARRDRQKAVTPTAILRLHLVALPRRSTSASVSAPPQPEATAPSHIPVARPRARAIRANPPASLPTVSSLPVPPVPRASDYVAGGNLLRGGMQLHPSGPHLPGTNTVIVPGLRLVDARTQGIGGAVRKLQALFGVPDPHCIEVDTWRTLSTRELLDRHLSPQQVADTAEHYGCGPGKS